MMFEIFINTWQIWGMHTNTHAHMHTNTHTNTLPITVPCVPRHQTHLQKPPPDASSAHKRQGPVLERGGLSTGWVSECSDEKHQVSCEWLRAEAVNYSGEIFRDVICLTIPVFFSCSSAAVDLGGVWGWDTQRADSLFGSLEDNAEDVVLCLDGWSCSEGARNPMRGEPGGSAQGQHSMYNHILVIGQKPALKLFRYLKCVFSLHFI